MLRTLKSQLLLYGVALTWLVGGTIAFVGYWRIGDAIRDEVNARVRDVVEGAALQLEDERRWVDRTGVAEGWAGLVKRTGTGEELEVPELIAVAAEARDSGHAIGFIERPGTGLWLAGMTRIENGRIENGRIEIVECPLRGAHHLTDQLRDQLFSQGDPAGERATVTIFEGSRRIATNVRRRDGERAVNTLVSAPVAERVLVEGKPFNGRAWVVNE